MEKIKQIAVALRFRSPGAAEKMRLSLILLTDLKVSSVYTRRKMKVYERYLTY